MVFPELAARDLNGVTRRLPDDLPGDPTLVLVVFRMHQQTDVETWLRLFAGVPVIEVPLLDSNQERMEQFIEQGMRIGVPDHEGRARTWTAYTALGTCLLGTDPVDTREIQVLLVRPDGEILARATGPAAPGAVERIRPFVGPH